MKGPDESLHERLALNDNYHKIYYYLSQIAIGLTPTVSRID